MQKVILGIGIPGAGKSTLLEEFADTNRYTLISPDAIRNELTGNALDQTKNRAVWNEVFRRTYRAILRGETVVVDATFARSDERKEFLAFLRNHKVPRIEGVFIDAKIETAKERNVLRNKEIPDYAIERMHKSLTDSPPQLEDGFDALFTFDEYQRLQAVEREKDGETQRKMWNIK